MDVRIILTLVTLSLTPALWAGSASAQFHVDSRIYTSAGSCASCDFSNKKMTRLNLNNADFSGSKFTRANLSGGRFSASNLQGAQFDKAYLVRLRGHQIDLTRASFNDATLTEATISDSVMTKTDFRRADLSRGTFFESDFTDANLSGVIAPDAKFEGSQFVGAQFDNINLRNAMLDRGNFSNARFGNAILLDASMIGANLSNADLSQAQGLSQTQLDTACGDYNTRLPFGLSLPYCDSVLAAEAMSDKSSHNHSGMDPKTKRAAERLDRAISELEKVMRDPEVTNKKTRRSLQNIHSDLMSSRRSIQP